MWEEELMSETDAKEAKTEAGSDQVDVKRRAALKKLKKLSGVSAIAAISLMSTTRTAAAS